MKIILDDIRKVVEYNLRTIAKYQGKFENGWKDTIVGADNVTYTLDINFKHLRDAISQSIYDILTDTLVTGELSQGNTQGTVVKQDGTGKINLELGNGLIKLENGTIKLKIENSEIEIKDGTVQVIGNGTVAGIARLGDTVQVSGTATGVCSNGGTCSVPINITGTITSGSTTVKVT